MQGNVKGCLELKDYVVELRKNTNGTKELSLNPLAQTPNKTLKRYVLLSKDNGDLELWRDSIEKIIKFRFLDTKTLEVMTFVPDLLINKSSKI
jgi:hypothetical protein